ncbi:hypothetical protein CVU37_09415 [candidate division BRC1 bacterium HGW-BRC1-1]|jgi:hypothetical protein|nr:MAG: hypothetical protein CVU37_09415 [candidate division BRC1 bacterium HGW-BRC1-1]
MAKPQSSRQFAFRLALLVGVFSWIYWRFSYAAYNHLPWGARVAPPVIVLENLIFLFCAFISVALSLSYVGPEASRGRSAAVAFSVFAGVLTYGIVYTWLVWLLFQSMRGLQIMP